MAEHVEASRVYSLPRDTLLVSGPDRTAWLDGLVTCSLQGMAKGRGAFGLLLTKQGKILSDLYILADERSLFVGVAPGRGPALRDILERYLVMEDAELALAPRHWFARVASEAEQPIATETSVATELPVATAAGRIELNGLTLMVAASEVPLEPRPAAELMAILAQRGVGAYGVDFSEADNPHEASLERAAVSWTKGCYLGQEVVCMQDMRGRVKRRLVPLELEAAAPGDAVDALVGQDVVVSGSGAVVGRVTSVHARIAGGVVLLGCLSAGALDAHASFEVAGRRARVLNGASTDRASEHAPPRVE
jgi:hypothetical protein